MYLITCVLLIKLRLGSDTAVFDATLPTTISIIQGETKEEQVEALGREDKGGYLLETQREHKEDERAHHKGAVSLEKYFAPPA